MRSKARQPGRLYRWEKGLPLWQRGAITLALLGVIGVAGLNAWKQWRVAYAEGPGATEPPPRGLGRRSYGLPIPEGAHVVLPPGAIPAVKDPEFVSVASAQHPRFARRGSAGRLPGPSSPMILVTHKNETHVYSMYLLDSHEIVNDVIAGEPIATTW